MNPIAVPLRLIYSCFYVRVKRLKPHEEFGKNEKGVQKMRLSRDSLPNQFRRANSSTVLSLGIGDSSEEHSNAAYEEEAATVEEVAYREPTMYDHFLKMLSGSESFAEAHKKRWYFVF